MKYIINNSKLFDSIYKYIDDEFVNDNLSYDYELDPDTEEYEENILNFMGEKYINGDDDNFYFTYIKKEYYENLHNNDEFKEEWIDKAPLLEFYKDSSWYERMNGFFGTYWKPVFEKWFFDNYPDLPVKTFM